MTGNVTSEALKVALNLPDGVKEKVRSYETRNWAANLASKSVSPSWKSFINKLGQAIKEDKLDDEAIVNLIQYLSTIDTAQLLEEIGKLDPGKQHRFLDLLNWMVEKSPDEDKQRAAASVQERILMAYRMAYYPRVYSPDRLARAMQVMTTSQK